MVQIEWIEATGTQYIDTGVPGNTTDIRVEMSYMPTAGYTTEHPVLCADWSANAIFLMLYQNRWRYHSGGASVDVYDLRTTDFTLITCEYSQVTIDGVGHSVAASTANSSNSLQIWGKSTYQYGALGSGKLKYCKIYSGATLLKDLIPVKDDYDVVCLYDRVGDTYLYNAGTGNFYGGGEVTPGTSEFIGLTRLTEVFGYIKTKLDAKVSDNPTFTEAVTRANIASGESFSTILGKIKKFFSDLKTVAFSGSYNDLSNKPTIPTVNNGVLTIQKDGETVQTFSANQSANATANIPSDTSELSDSEPYVLRQGKGDLVDLDIEGGSVAWNQLVSYKLSSGSTTQNDLTLSWTNDGTYSIVGTASADTTFTNVFTHESTIVGHKYYLSGGKAGMTIRVPYASANDLGNGAIFSVTQGNAEGRVIVANGTAFNTAVSFKPILVDLTQLFGSTIADYIYSLEQANAGDGVAWFRQYFPNAYYAYDAGSIQSVNVSGRKVVGFNQWDEIWENGGLNSSTGANTVDNNKIRSKNYIPVISDKIYYNGASEDLQICMYDSSYTYLGVAAGTTAGAEFTLNPQTRYIRFNAYNSYGKVYKNDICINISDHAKNGTYEPYTTTTYPLDSSKTLLGLFQLVNGKLKASGDIYKASGEITRKFNIITPDKTENWQLQGDGTETRRFALFITGLYPTPSNNNGSFISSNLTPVNIGAGSNSNPFGVFYISNSWIVVPDKNSYFANITAFNSWLDSSNFSIVYELATPTTENALSYQNPQRAYPDGTEEFIDYSVSQSTRDVAIPCGNNSTYTSNKVIQPIADYIDCASVTINYVTGWQSNGDTRTYGWRNGSVINLALSLERPDDRSLSTGWTDIASVSYAPSSSISCPCVIFTTGNTYMATVRLEIEPSGNIRIYSPNALSQVMRIISNITYLM